MWEWQGGALYRAVTLSLAMQGKPGKARGPCARSSNSRGPETTVLRHRLRDQGRRRRHDSGRHRSLVYRDRGPPRRYQGADRPGRSDAAQKRGENRRNICPSRHGAAMSRCRALPRGNAVLERLGQLLVDELKGKTFFEVSHHPRLDLAEQDQRFQRRPVFRGDGGAGQRHVDHPAGHLGAVLKRHERDRVARDDAVVAAVFRQIEDIAVGKPGQLGSEFVALARGGAHGHGETVVDNAGDLAFDPADMVEIGDDAIADIADAGRQQGEPPRRHIDDLAWKFAAVRQHIAAEQMNPHPLKTAALFGGRKYRSFVRQRHLRHPTTGCSVSPDPTADRVNEALQGFCEAGQMTQEVVLSVAAIETLAGPYAGQLEATPQGRRSASAAGAPSAVRLSPNLCPMAPPGKASATPGVKYRPIRISMSANPTSKSRLQRCYGGDALKLKAHGEANREQDRKHEPAVVQHLTPLKSPRNLGRGAAPVNRRASIATRQDWHRRGVHIGSPRPNKFNQQSRRAEERRMAM